MGIGNPKTKPIETGYEVFSPLSGEVSTTLSQLRVIWAMLLRAVEKREKGYVDYAVSLNSHHLLRLLARFAPGKLDDMQREVVQMPNGIERLEILNKIYLACRILDDAVDGDSPKKLSPDEILAYVQSVVTNFESGQIDPRNVVDAFFGEAMTICKRIGLDIRKQVHSVLSSLQFDASRRAEFMKTGKPQFYSQEDLSRNYYQLDITGTVGACLELTDEGDTEENRKIIEPLAIACRIFYDIRDLANETKGGLINITAEDAARFNIDIDELATWAKTAGDLTKAPTGVQAWIKERTALGKTLLQEYYKLIENSGFKKSTKFILQKKFVDQCEPFFRNIDKKFGTTTTTAA